MTVDDDWFEETTTSAGGWGFQTTCELRKERVKALMVAPLPDEDDLDVAISLTRLVHSELELYGTSGGQRLDDEGIELVQRGLVRILARLDIPLKFPWRNFVTFQSYWNRNGCYGSWQARRDLLHDHFNPVFESLDQLELAHAGARLAEGVSPHARTGWVAVDVEVEELRRRFRSASTPQDYRDVGNRCVAALEALSRTIYDPAKHLRPGEEEPPVASTKKRLERYVEDSLAGKENLEVRGLATKVINLAQAVKHASTPSRRDAGIAADSVILLVNILRRVDQDQ